MARQSVQTGGVKGKTGFYRDPKSASEAYGRAESAKAKDRIFRNFSRTKQRSYMTTYNDVHFLSVMKTHLADVTTGNPLTALQNILDTAWEVGAKTGNIKDLDSTQEANFKTWVANWLYLAWDVCFQQLLRPFVPAFTEASGTATSATALAIWIQADWDNFIQSLEKLDCPDFVYKFIEPFAWYIKMSDAYEKAGLEVPPSYFIPFCHFDTYSNHQSNREEAKSVMANAMLHCKKFGIPFSKFSADKLKCREIHVKDMWNDQNVVSYFCHMQLKYHGSGGAVTIKPTATYTGANLDSDYDDAKYAFIDGVEHSKITPLFGIFRGTYNATNNKYGGIFAAQNCDTNEYEFNGCHTSLLGTSWTPMTLSSLNSLHIFRLFACGYVSDAAKQMEWQGTAVTAAQSFAIESWAASQINPNIVWGNASVGYQEQHDSMLTVIRMMLYGE